MAVVVHNKAMERGLDNGTTVDVNTIGERLPDFPGVWVLDDFLDELDYCDAEEERWIFSIGRHKHDGKYYAAVDARFYQNPLFECVWLR